MQSMGVRGHHTSSCCVSRHSGTNRLRMPNYGKTYFGSRNGPLCDPSYFAMDIPSYYQIWLKPFWGSMEAVAWTLAVYSGDSDLRR